MRTLWNRWPRRNCSIGSWTTGERERERERKKERERERGREREREREREGGGGEREREEKEGESERAREGGRESKKKNETKIICKDLNFSVFIPSFKNYYLKSTQQYVHGTMKRRVHFINNRKTFDPHEQ